MNALDDYRRLSRAVAGQSLPLALVDLDAVDANLARLRAPVAQAKKRLRVATKSLRCPALVEHITTGLGAVAGGLLTYSAQETLFWAERGARDLLLAYPTVQPSDLAALAAIDPDVALTMVVDSREQLAALSAFAVSVRRSFAVVLDLDMSYRPLGAAHLGVRRSPLHDVADVVALAEHARNLPRIELVGLLGYEAQIAGLPDHAHDGRWARWPERLLKRVSLGDVHRRRAAAVAALERVVGSPLRLVNGGGSGSIDSSAADPSLTEIAAGSGFVDSHLFDHYDGLALVPALYFALQITRRPAPNLVTCLGGGLIASGAAGRDRLPRPTLPPGGRLLPLEGAGEVQTPVAFDPARFAVDELPLGAPLFFRHAKAGELAEHFNEYLFVRGDRIVERAPTYRGLGHAFLG